MTVTVEVDDSLLRDAMSATGSCEQRQVVEEALRFLLKQRSAARLIRRLGVTELNLSPADLCKLRWDE
jgi:Arc/MetJ family transcription regulator